MRKIFRPCYECSRLFEHKRPNFARVSIVMYIIVKYVINIYFKMKFTCLLDSVCSPFIPLLLD